MKQIVRWEGCDWITDIDCTVRTCRGQGCCDAACRLWTEEHQV